MPSNLSVARKMQAGCANRQQTSMQKTIEYDARTQDGVQALRAIASLAVVFQHVTYFALASKSIDYQPFLRIDLGQFGVRVFFLISGFVMAGCLHQGSSFLLKRIARVYPPYWLAIGLSAGLLLWLDPAWHIDLQSVLLDPTAADLNNTLRIPYWTLLYEVSFYALLSCLALGRASGQTVRIFCVVWFAAIVAFSVYHAVPHFTPGYLVLLAPINVFFITGILLAHEMQNQRLRSMPGSWLAFGGLGAWWLATIPALAAPPAFVLQAVSYACLLVLLTRMPMPRLLVRLGDTSYGMYLAHTILAVVTVQWLANNGYTLGIMATWAVVFSVAMVGSIAFGWLEYLIHTRLVRRWV